MNDEFCQELERYFDGELPAAERDRLEVQLSADPAAMRYLEQLRLLRRLADRHDPSSATRLAGPLVVRPWDRAAAGRRHAWLVSSAAAAAAAAIIGLVWYANSLRKLENSTPKVAASSTHAGKSLKPVESLGSGPDASGAPRPVRPSLELDAQRFAWANGEVTSPTAAARIVLDSRSRHGSRSSNAEILAIELAHAPPNTMHAVARMVAERSVSIRQPPQPPRAGVKAPPATPNSPQGWFNERGQRGRELIASAALRGAPAMSPHARVFSQSSRDLNDRGCGSQTCRVSLSSLWPEVVL